MALTKKNPKATNFPDNSMMGIRIRYFAILNPKGVNKLAYENGYQPPRDDIEQRVLFLNEFIANEGEKGMTDFIAIHPDKDFILDNLIDEIKSDSVDKNIDSWSDSFMEVVKLKKGLPEVSQPVKVVDNYAAEKKEDPKPIIIQVPVQEQKKGNDKPITMEHVQTALMAISVVVILVIGYKLIKKYV